MLCQRVSSLRSTTDEVGVAFVERVCRRWHNMLSPALVKRRR